MTASQFTGGSFKHVNPSNYQSGKSGSEVTIHWCVVDGADEAEQIAMGERARAEAIRLAMGADRPHQYAPSQFPREGMTVAEPTVPPTPPAAVTEATPVPAAIGTSAGPIATTAAPPSEEQITDEMLRDSATHHAARIRDAAPKDPVSQETAARKISGLIAKFVSPPKTLYTIDQAQRRQFLDGLAAL